MQRLWSTDELTERWALSPEDLALTVGHTEQASSASCASSPSGASTRASPTSRPTSPPRWSSTWRARSACRSDVLDGYDFAGRSGRRHRRMILDHLAVASFDDAAEAAFRAWLLADCLPREPAPLALEEAVAGWFARERTVRPGAYRLDRILRSARAAHDDAVLATSGRSPRRPHARAARRAAGR